MKKGTQPFKKRYTVNERMEKSKKQLSQNPGKLVIIVEKHPKSLLPSLNNPRFICEKDYKFSLIKNMLQKKIREAGKSADQTKQSYFITVGGQYPNPQSTMMEIYEKYKDEDGFLYFQYQDHQAY